MYVRQLYLKAKSDKELLVEVAGWLFWRPFILMSKSSLRDAV